MAAGFIRLLIVMVLGDFYSSASPRKLNRLGRNVANGWLATKINLEEFSAESLQWLRLAASESVSLLATFHSQIFTNEHVNRCALE